MPFDRENPSDLAALQSEQINDPLVMGYAALDNTNKQVALINDPDSNKGNETTGEELTTALLLDLIVPDDLTVGGQFSQGELEYIKMILEASSFSGESIERYRSKILLAFGNSTTADNINAATRRISRAEVLFGIDTTITREDWIAARDYQP